MTYSKTFIICGDCKKRYPSDVFMTCPDCARPNNTQNIEIILNEDNNQKILFVLHNSSMLRLLKSFFWSKGYSPVTTNNGEDALEASRRESPDVIVLEKCLPDMDALTVCRRIRTESAVPIIILAPRFSATKDFRDLGLIDIVETIRDLGFKELMKRINSILTEPSNL